MEYYESTCSKCRHRWQWVGYKTGIGKTHAQLEEMRTAGKTCPRCGGAASVGLDNTSEDARGLNSALGAVVGALVGARPLPPKPEPELKIRTASDNRQLGPEEVQFESVLGAVSAEVFRPDSDRYSPVPVVRITTVRGIQGRKAQIADLDVEALDAFIAHLTKLRGRL